MANYKLMLKEVRAELAKLEPQYNALKETERGLVKLASDSNTLDIKIPRGAFKDMTARLAVLKCLSLSDQPLKSRQLADLIIGAGFEHGAKDFANSLNTVVDRQYKIYEEITKNDDGWAINDKGKAFLAEQTKTLTNNA